MSSRFKDDLRKRYTDEAEKKVAEIRSQLKKQTDKPVPAGRGCCIFGVLILVIPVIWEVLHQDAHGLPLPGALSVGFVIAALLCVIVTAGYFIQRKTKTSSLEDAAEKEINEIYEKNRERINREIAQYDQKVKEAYDQIVKNPEKIKEMVIWTSKMFDRMISHADHSPHIAFVEATLHFEVFNDRIQYSYDHSHYSSPQDDYRFDLHRFRNLTCREECEALAKAVTVLTIKRMEKKYAADSCHINMEHDDALVKLEYSGANPNYIPPKDIL